MFMCKFLIMYELEVPIENMILVYNDAASHISQQDEYYGCDKEDVITAKKLLAGEKFTVQGFGQSVMPIIRTKMRDSRQSTSLITADRQTLLQITTTSEYENGDDAPFTLKRGSRARTAATSRSY